MLGCPHFFPHSFCPHTINEWFDVQMLAKKVDTLTKAMESEAKKMRRDVAAMEKEVVAMRLEKEQDTKARRFGSSSASANS